MTKTRKGASPTLSKGQLWKTNDAYIHIVELGKTLIHYRMTRSLKQKGVITQLSAIGTMMSYLKRKDAQLVRQRVS